MQSDVWQIQSEIWQIQNEIWQIQREIAPSARREVNGGDDCAVTQRLQSFNFNIPSVKPVMVDKTTDDSSGSDAYADIDACKCWQFNILMFDFH